MSRKKLKSTVLIYMRIILSKAILQAVEAFHIFFLVRFHYDLHFTGENNSIFKQRERFKIPENHEGEIRDS